MYKVMLVDDEPSVLKGLTDLIDWSTLDTEIVACVSSANEALSLLKRIPTDILITDICMPDVNGLTLITEAKTINQDLRFIVISAYDEFEYVKMSLKLGVENYLLKPINEGELTETLKKTIENIERAGFLSPASFEAMAFRNNILDRWVNSSIQDFELAGRAELLQINLDSSEYRVIVIANVASASMSEHLSYTVTMLEKIRHDLAKHFSGFELFIDRYANIVIILDNKEISGYRKSLNEFTNRLCRMLSDDFFVSVGNSVNSAYSVGLSYKCAYSLLPIKFLQAASPVYCDDYPLAQCITSADMLSFEQAFESDDLEVAKKTVTKHARVRSQKTPAHLLKQLMPYQLKLLSFFNDFMQNKDPVPERVLKPLQSLSYFTDCTQVMESFLDILKTAMQELKQKQDSLHPIVKNSIRILETSYGRDISLKLIADQFNIHPVYLGRLFKEETGQLFNDYLTSLRLKKARYLLACTDKKIKDICEEIGITQQSYFNRLFKKQYSVTPTDYRRTIAENNM